LKSLNLFEIKVFSIEYALKFSRLAVLRSQQKIKQVEKQNKAEEEEESQLLLGDEFHKA
jgi:hypothetical protein